MIRKGPGYMAQMYGTGRRKFLEAAKGYRDSIAGGACTALAEIEQRILGSEDMDFAAAAGATLAAMNADPRNHFGKHALRRFE